MKSLYFSFLLLFVIFGCKEDNLVHQQNIDKVINTRRLVFESIHNNWNFQPKIISPEAQIITNDWNYWRLFTSELYQKPKGTIGAFQRKIKNLSQKIDVLPNTIPSEINKPQIKTRLNALITKIKALETFINLDIKPEKKILTLLFDIDNEMVAFQDQIEEIIKRRKISREEGEKEMLESLPNKKTLIESLNEQN